MNPLTLLLLAASASAIALPISFDMDANQTSVDYFDFNVQSCACAPEARYFSCESPTAVSNTSCCYENYGLIMQTQFWTYNRDYLSKIKDKSNDTAELECFLSSSQTDIDLDEDYLSNIDGEDSVNASEVFTVHGLWSDLCNGSYKTFCRKNLNIPESANLTGLISETFDRPDMLEAMLKYWTNSTGSDVKKDSISLWRHEYNKHGTCFNTLQPKCFAGSYTKHQAAMAYFQKTLEVWNELPTYKFLLQAGITPSLEMPYALSDIEQALKVAHQNKKVRVGCTKGAIDEVWYYYQIRGSALDGDYVATDSVADSDCPSYVWYLPK